MPDDTGMAMDNQVIKSTFKNIFSGSDSSPACLSLDSLSMNSCTVTAPNSGYFKHTCNMISRLEWRLQTVYMVRYSDIKKKKKRIKKNLQEPTREGS